MWRMAGDATLSFDRLMLKNERTLFVSVARVAHLISCRCRAQLLADEPTVRIVTIRALNESLFHPVVERHVELWFDLLMAAVAQGRLSFGQKEFIGSRVVSGVAA